MYSGIVTWLLAYQFGNEKSEIGFAFALAAARLYRVAQLAGRSQARSSLGLIPYPYWGLMTNADQYSESITNHFPQHFRNRVRW